MVEGNNKYKVGRANNILRQLHEKTMVTKFSEPSMSNATVVKKIVQSTLLLSWSNTTTKKYIVVLVLYVANPFVQFHAFANPPESQTTMPVILVSRKPS